VKFATPFGGQRHYAGKIQGRLPPGPAACPAAVEIEDKGLRKTAFVWLITGRLPAARDHALPGQHRLEHGMVVVFRVHCCLSSIPTHRPCAEIRLPSIMRLFLPFSRDNHLDGFPTEAGTAMLIEPASPPRGRT
jgi:hypothetical protein